jgi:hypothetical protein
VGMTHGRKAYGTKKKVKKDFTHFIKKKHKREMTKEEKATVETGHPASKKSLEHRLRKPRKRKK